MTTAQTLPHWDLTEVYPSLQAPEFEQGFQDVVDDIASLAALFDKYGIGGEAAEAAPATGPETVAAFDAVTERMNAVLAAVQTLSAYIQSFVATNSRDDLAQA